MAWKLRQPLGIWKDWKKNLVHALFNLNAWISYYDLLFSKSISILKNTDVFICFEITFRLSLFISYTIVFRDPQ